MSSGYGFWSRVIAAGLTLTTCGGDDPAVNFEVTVTDEGCTIIGPESVPAGTYSLLLVDDTAVGEFELYVRKITHGRTYQDLLDAQPAPGEMFNRPDFVENVVMSDEELSSEDLADNGGVNTWDLEPGRHAIHAGRLDVPDALWICASLFVMETDADVARIIRRDFAETPYEDVEQILKAYGTGSCDDGEREGDAMVRLAALKLAAGELDRLRSEIELACLDFRDVLAPAHSPGLGEYVTEKGQLPEGDELVRLISADWEQYQTWLYSPTPSP